jgi:2-dehydropantoate 2-reductase
MRHAVLGSGGVGGLVAAALARVGGDVVVVGRPATIAVTPAVTVVDSAVLGTFEVALPFVPELDRAVDVVWIATKSTGLEAALNLIPPDVVGDAVVVPLLNGVDHVAVLRARYRRVVAGVMRVESERIAPGRIEQRSSFIRIDLADGEDIAAELSAAGISTRVGQDELSLLWGKLAFLAPLALTTTALNSALGPVRTHPLYLAAQAETEQIATAVGAQLDIASLEQVRAAAADTMRSSMQNDVKAGRPPELDAIAGPIIRGAQQHNISIPATTTLVEQIQAALPTPQPINPPT